MSTPRVSPGGFRETGPVIWVFSRLAGVATGTNTPHIFTTLGRGRGLFWGWLHFAGKLMPGGVLPRRETELLILRVAHLRESAYEFEHHLRLGKRAGVTEADVAAVIAGPAVDHWTPREAALLSAADELIATKDLGDEGWYRIRQFLDDRETVELLLLVGHYDMLATTLHVLRVQPDRPRLTRRLAKRLKRG